MLKAVLVSLGLLVLVSPQVLASEVEEPGISKPSSYVERIDLVFNIMSDLQTIISLNDDTLTSSGADLYLVAFFNSLVAIATELNSIHKLEAEGKALEMEIVQTGVLVKVNDLYFTLALLKRSLPSEPQTALVTDAIKAKVDLLSRSLN